MGGPMAVQADPPGPALFTPNPRPLGTRHLSRANCKDSQPQTRQAVEIARLSMRLPPFIRRSRQSRALSAEVIALTWGPIRADYCGACSTLYTRARRDESARCLR